MDECVIRESIQLREVRHAILCQLPIGSSVLDIGCGALIDRRVWLQREFKVIAVDPCQKALEKGMAHIPSACKSETVALCDGVLHGCSVHVLNSKAPECFERLERRFNLAVCAFSLNHCKSLDEVRQSLHALRKCSDAIVIQFLDLELIDSLNEDWVTVEKTTHLEVGTAHVHTEIGGCATSELCMSAEWWRTAAKAAGWAPDIPHTQHVLDAQRLSESLSDSQRAPKKAKRMEGPVAGPYARCVGWLCAGMSWQQSNSADDTGPLSLPHYSSSVQLSKCFLAANVSLRNSDAKLKLFHTLLGTDTEQCAWLQAAVHDFAAQQLQHHRASIVHHTRSIEMTGHATALNALLATQEITPTKICSVHKLLGVPNGGAWRTVPIRAGVDKFPEATCIASAMQEYTDALPTLLARKDLPICAKAAWAAYHFVRVHPFADGNGRISRMLLNWVLKHEGVPFTIAMGANVQQRADYIYAMRGGFLAPEEASRPLSSVIDAALIMAWDAVDRKYADIEADHVCAICLELVPELQREGTPCCEKVYHTTCLERWLGLKKDQTCPTCRQSLLTNEADNASESSNDPQGPEPVENWDWEQPPDIYMHDDYWRHGYLDDDWRHGYSGSY